MATYETPNFLGAVLGGGGKSSGGDDMQTVMQALTNAQNNAIAREKLALEKDISTKELENRIAVAGIQKEASKYSADASASASKYGYDMNMAINQLLQQDNIDRRINQQKIAAEATKVFKEFNGSELGLDSKNFIIPNEYTAGKMVDNKFVPTQHSKWSWDANKGWFMDMQKKYGGTAFDDDEDENIKIYYDQVLKSFYDKYGEGTVNKIIERNGYLQGMNYRINNQLDIDGGKAESDGRGLFKYLNTLENILRDNKWKETEKLNKNIKQYGESISPANVVNLAMYRTLPEDALAKVVPYLEKLKNLQTLLGMTGNYSMNTLIPVKDQVTLNSLDPNSLKFILDRYSTLSAIKEEEKKKDKGTIYTGDTYSPITSSSKEIEGKDMTEEEILERNRNRNFEKLYNR